eukprot:PhM_4_TR2110/c0_g1_i1/m.57465
MSFLDFSDAASAEAQNDSKPDIQSASTSLDATQTVFHWLESVPHTDDEIILWWHRLSHVLEWMSVRHDNIPSPVMVAMISMVNTTIAETMLKDTIVSRVTPADARDQIKDFAYQWKSIVSPPLTDVCDETSYQKGADASLVGAKYPTTNSTRSRNTLATGSSSHSSNSSFNELHVGEHQHNSPADPFATRVPSVTIEAPTPTHNSREITVSPTRHNRTGSTSSEVILNILSAPSRTSIVDMCDVSAMTLNAASQIQIMETSPLPRNLMEMSKQAEVLFRNVTLGSSHTDVVGFLEATARHRRYFTIALTVIGVVLLFAGVHVAVACTLWIMCLAVDIAYGFGQGWRKTFVERVQVAREMERKVTLSSLYCAVHPTKSGKTLNSPVQSQSQSRNHLSTTPGGSLLRTSASFRTAASDARSEASADLRDTVHNEQIVIPASGALLFNVGRERPKILRIDAAVLH